MQKYTKMIEKNSVCLTFFYLFCAFEKIIMCKMKYFKIFIISVLLAVVCNAAGACQAVMRNFTLAGKSEYVYVAFRLLIRAS